MVFLTATIEWIGDGEGKNRTPMSGRQELCELRSLPRGVSGFEQVLVGFRDSTYLYVLRNDSHVFGVDRVIQANAEGQVERIADHAIQGIYWPKSVLITTVSSMPLIVLAAGLVVNEVATTLLTDSPRLLFDECSSTIR